MIRGLHGLFYTPDADAARAFLRDQLRLPFSDVGGGWLIFDVPEGDLGVHPTEGPEGSGTPGRHELSFYCDDIVGTCAELAARGVVFKHEPQDHGYGWVTYFTIPGGLEVQLYEPKYRKTTKATKTKAKARTKAKTRTRTRTKTRTKTKAKPKAKARR